MKYTNVRGFYMLLIAIVAVTLACRGGLSSRESKSEDIVQNGSGSIIQVSAREFSFSLPTTDVKAGTITFVVQNDGTMEHDFAIRGNGLEQKTSKIRPGESASLTVVLEPGTYTYLCTIPGHEQAGMVGTFTVIAD